MLHCILSGAAYITKYNSHFRFGKKAVSNETCGIKSREF